MRRTVKDLVWNIWAVARRENIDQQVHNWVKDGLTMSYICRGKHLYIMCNQPDLQGQPMGQQEY